MILILEPEKLTARIILGVIIVAGLTGAMFAASYGRDKLNEFSIQRAENVKLKTDLAEQTDLVAKLTNELAAKESQVLNMSSSVNQLRDKTKKLEPALAQCQATVNSQKSTIKIYKDYYYLTNGR